jgi:hypothetical protein
MYQSRDPETDLALNLFSPSRSGMASEIEIQQSGGVQGRDFSSVRAAWQTAHNLVLEQAKVGLSISNE